MEGDFKAAQSAAWFLCRTFNPRLAKHLKEGKEIKKKITFFFMEKEKVKYFLNQKTK